MNKLIKSFFVLFLPLVSFSQEIKRSVVEHFTNTSCSICAANNGNIYNSVKSNSNLLHITFHPSSPYSNDIFNVLNKDENDNRTKFYGVFGGTPRIVFNGSPIGINSLNSRISQSQNEMTNFSIRVNSSIENSNQINVEVIIKKLAFDTLTSANIFIGVVEDTVFQTTNNGENIHLNVFRKSFTKIEGDNIQLPVGVGDSILINFSLPIQNVWNINRLFNMAILQDNSKTVINTASDAATLLLNNENRLKQLNNLNIYPNPNSSNLLMLNEELDELLVFSSTGNLIKRIEKIKKGDLISIEDLAPGVYFISAYKNEIIYKQKLIRL